MRDDGSHVSDEASGEWVAAGASPAVSDAVVVRDSADTVLAGGDQVTLNGRYGGIKNLVLRAEFVRER